MGRPSKLTPAVQKRVCQAIRLGLTYEDAAKAAGISYETLNNWRKEGEAAKSGKFFQFFKALQRAEVAGQLANARIVQRAARGGETVEETRVVVKMAAPPPKRGETGQAAGAAEQPPLTVVEETTTTVTKTALPDWRAAAFILERRHHETWGRKDQISVDVDWKKEAKDAGVNPSELFEQVVAQFTAALEAGDRQDDGGGLGGGEAAGGEPA